jgi:hypothetical protein
MLDGRGRWSLLALFAVGNLLVWVSIACLVGLCAGDDVDLGVETLVRHAQATAVNSWEEAKSGGLSALAGKGSVPTPRARVWDGQGSVSPALAAVGNPYDDNLALSAPPAATPSPPDAASTRAGSSPRLVPLAPAATGVESAGSSQAASNSEPSAKPAQPKEGVDAGTSEPATLTGAAPGVAVSAVVSSPLLLVDPVFHDLAALNSEMERSAPARAVQIRYQEEALNREIAAIWRNNPSLPYRDVEVDLQHDRVSVSGRVSILGFEVDALLEGTIVARDCVPRLEVEAVSLAGVTTPRFVRTRVVAMAKEAMAWYPADYPLCLEQIVLEEMRATFYGYLR